MPSRILYFDHTAQLSGGEIALLDLLRCLDRSRFEPVVILAADGPLRQRLAEIGVTCEVLPLDAGVAEARKDTLGLRSLLRLKDVATIAAYCRRLAQRIREHDVDLVHTNSLKADLIGRVAAWLAGRRVVWHGHDRLEPDYLPRAVVTAFRAACRWMPDQVIANSEATLATLNLPAGSPAEVVYPGIPHALTLPADDASSPARPNASAGPRIGIVGRLAPWKGQHVFLDAAARLAPRYPAARFFIIGGALFGEQAYERELRDRADRLGLRQVVSFTGFRSDVQPLIRELDVLVHASITPEPFGKVITEAMAAARPVVATDGGGVREIVAHGSTGLLVPMNDAPAMAEAIASLLADPAGAAGMGACGRQRVRDRFTAEHAARRTAVIYDQMLDTPRPVPASC